jgi:hypothetical protein
MKTSLIECASEQFVGRQANRVAEVDSVLVCFSMRRLSVCLSDQAIIHWEIEYLRDENPWNKVLL